MFVIPDLSKAAFTRVEVDVAPGLDGLPDVPHEVVKKLADAIPSGSFSLGGGCKTFSEPCVLLFTIDTQLGVKLSIEMDWVAAAQVEGTIHHQGTRLKPIEQISAPDFGAQVDEKLSLLYGCKLFGGSECHFELKIDELPSGGIVRRGIAARARFGDDTLRLAGAQFAINGENWSRLSWFIEPQDPDPDWQSIEGVVSSIGEKEIGPTLLADIVESAQQSVDRYVLESLATYAK